MGSIDLSGLSDGALLLIDTPPIIYWLEQRPALAEHFAPLFDRHASGGVRFAVTTITIAEVMTGPLQKGDHALARRYRAVLESWRVVELDAGLAEDAARVRASFKLKLPDAIQVAAALAVNAEALVTYDRDFGRLKSLRVIG